MSTQEYTSLGSMNAWYYIGEKPQQYIEHEKNCNPKNEIIQRKTGNLYEHYCTECKSSWSHDES